MSTTKAVILDIDGTLLNSNDEHAQAYHEAGNRLGLDRNFDEIRRRIGKGGDKLIPEVFNVPKDSDTGKRLDELKGQIFKKNYLPRLKPTAGARALLTRMKSDGMKLIVATSASKDDVNSLLDRAEVRDLINGIVSSDDVDASKPDPDVVQAAIQKTGEAASEVIMLGDTPYDVESAQRAGILIIAIRCGGWNDADLRGAEAIYDDPADLLMHYDRSPLQRHNAA